MARCGAQTGGRQPEVVPRAVPWPLQLLDLEQVLEQELPEWPSQHAAPLAARARLLLALALARPLLVLFDQLLQPQSVALGHQI